MKSRRLPTTVVAVTAITALTVIGFGIPTAGAAGVDLGSQCTPSIGTANQMLVNTTGTSVVAPFSGVITKWGFIFPSNAGLPTALVTLHGSGSNWTVVSTTATVPIDANETAVPTRIPIAAGDRIGMSPTGLGCAATPADTVEKTAAASIPTPGTVYATGSPTVGNSTDLSARLEPDADGDGYGDETQDGCPQSAKFQSVCPTPKLSALQLPYRGGFQAVVTTDIAGTAQATGQVKIPKSKGKKAKTLTFKSKSVATLPGVLTKVTLKWPSALNKALKSISSHRKLKVSVTLTAPGILSNATKKFTIKLAGKG